jgi:hypothetical protein
MQVSRCELTRTRGAKKRGSRRRRVVGVRERARVRGAKCEGSEVAAPWRPRTPDGAHHRVPGGAPRPHLRTSTNSPSPIKVSTRLCLPLRSLAPRALALGTSRSRPSLSFEPPPASASHQSAGRSWMPMRCVRTRGRRVSPATVETTRVRGQARHMAIDAVAGQRVPALRTATAAWTRSSPTRCSCSTGREGACMWRSIRPWASADAGGGSGHGRPVQSERRPGARIRPGREGAAAAETSSHTAVPAIRRSGSVMVSPAPRGWGLRDLAGRAEFAGDFTAETRKIAEGTRNFVIFLGSAPIPRSSALPR